ncbi:hypothetical protein I5L01_11755 [Erythrobacter sp. YJ-T3-07]|uniref:hypothetical protein n=1 Tax=Erythrobacter sp. YJ-T3-07 TaxID=2793063 RepID=UPI0018D497BA|nr:hypothetical protein [Erythrobacter sp. YJ-T3-07]MBH1944906.1 hypothetical protein [Erythrobacter sp. YJ-T3-07]
MTRRILAIGACALLLASCGGGEDAAESKEAEDTGPQGEVLGGTITDSMLPVVMVQSQSPKRGGDDNGDAADGRAGSGGAANDDAANDDAGADDAASDDAASDEGADPEQADDAE